MSTTEISGGQRLQQRSGRLESEPIPLEVIQFNISWNMPLEFWIKLKKVARFISEGGIPFGIPTMVHKKQFYPSFQVKKN